MTSLTLNKINRCIEIVCDGGKKYGFGHIRRSYALAQALKCCGYCVQYKAASKDAEKLLPRFTSSTLKPNIRVLDLPYEINNWLLKKDRNDIPIIALDYCGATITSCVISIFEHQLPPAGSRLSGLEYAIVRPEITQLTPVKGDNGVVVMIGGSDVNQVGGLVADFLASAEVKVDLILGPAYQGNYVTKSSLVTCLTTPLDLEKRMSACEWAVTNGGGSMMEMMYLGKAVHVMPQTRAERNFAEFILKKGGILGIGKNMLKIPDPEEIKSVGEKAKELIDGNGVDRIIRIIEKILVDE